MIPDFFALARPPRPRKVVRLGSGSRSLEIELQSMDLLDEHRAATLRRRMVDRYVPTEFRWDGASESPVDFPPVGGEPVLLSEELCDACAALVVMQVSPHLSFEQFVAMAATCPDLFQILSKEAAALNEQDAGKAVAASTTD